MPRSRNDTLHNRYPLTDSRRGNILKRRGVLLGAHACILTNICCKLEVAHSVNSAESLNDLAATDSTECCISEGMWSCFEEEIDSPINFKK